MEWEARYLNNEGALRRLENQLGSESFQLLISGSYGDILPNLALLNAFHNANGRTISVLVGDQWRALAHRFESEFVKYSFINTNQQQWLHAVLSSLGRPFIRAVGYLYPTLPTLHPMVADFILTERVTDYEAKRAILGLAVGTKMELPPLKPARLEEIYGTMSARGIPRNKGVLLSFHSNSNPIVDLTTQIAIVELSMKRGLKVVYNTAGAKIEPSFLKELEGMGVTLYDTPPDAPFEIVEYLGTYIGGAHGLTVMLASFPCNARMIQIVEKEPPVIRNNNRLIAADSLRVDRVLRGELLNKVSIVDLDRDIVSRIEDAYEK